MNPQTLQESLKILIFNKEVKKDKKIEVVICPPFVFLSKVKELLLNIKLGAQNCFFKEQGAYTGEISPVMLKGLGCKYVIIGHSERREYFNEENKNINRKIISLLKFNLTPILCIGETEKERKGNKLKEVLKKQIKEGLKGVDYKKIIIAYEPIWAIGTGKSCSMEDSKKVKEYISSLLKDAKVLYGGSVNGDNSEEYIKEAGYDGLLVGGASLKPKEFLKIIKSVN